MGRWAGQLSGLPGEAGRTDGREAGCKDRAMTAGVLCLRSEPVGRPHQVREHEAWPQVLL